jgi:dTDP-4-amino-4,6-dideoxygalactose transaminase
MSNLPAILGGPPVRPQGPPTWPIVDDATREALAQLAADGSWGRYHGPHCTALIAALRQHLSCEHVLLCSSGTAAVELALRGSGVRPGDEVILAAYDFKANFTNVLTLGATPVLVDVRADDWQLDVDQVETALSQRTRAVIASHLHGGLVDMPRLRDLADRHGFAIIEDACQSPGAVVAGRPAGTWGDVGVYSFGGSKLLTAGRGGAVFTTRDDIAQRIRLYTQRGNEAYPLSEMQAAVLVPQLAQLTERNRRRSENVAALATRLSAIDGLHLVQSPIGSSSPVYYKVGIRYCPAAFTNLPRDRFTTALRAEGIAIDPGFRALHLTHARSRFRAVGELPVATEVDAAALTLHHPVLLGDEADIAQIVEALGKIRDATGSGGFTR